MFGTAMCTLFIQLIYLSVFQSVSVRKRKKIGLIPIQATARSRRMYRMRGRRTALQGRPRKGQGPAVQLTVGDEEEQDGGIVRHKLPTKDRKRGAAHSLDSAVLANKRSTKKH